MKSAIRMGAVLAIAPLLSGCLLELLSTTAIQGTLAAESAKHAVAAKKFAEDQMARINLRRAIGAYYAEFGEYPPSLTVLAPEWLPSIPSKPDGSPYGYDPSTGTITDAPLTPVVEYVDPRTAMDFENQAKIQDAVDRFADASGYYPPALNELALYYLPTVPMTSSGQRFLYDPDSGLVRHPAELMAPPPASYGQPSGGYRAPAGGGGPLGEVMTGIQIQNQLGNMNNAGASAARGRAVGSLDRATRNNQDLQNRALRDLGLN